MKNSLSWCSNTWMIEEERLPLSCLAWPEAGYEGAIVWQKGSAPKEALKNSPSAGAGTSDSSTMASEDYNEWEDHMTPVRPLQQRSHLQLMPHTAEKFNHKRALQRKLERDRYFDHNAPSRKFKQVSHGYVSVKKRHTSSKS